MNNTFNPQRFSKLFKKHLIEHSKVYLLSIVVLFGISLLVLEFIVFTNNGKFKDSDQVAFFVAILSIAGSIFTSLSFNNLGNKREAVNALTLPASHFEKYLLQWIFSFVIFQLVYTGAFYLADIIVVCLNPGGIFQKIPFKNTVFNIFDPSNGAYAGFIFYFFLHSLAFWGAIFFDKLHFIKTTFAFFVTLITFNIFGQTFLTAMIGREISHNSIPYQGFSFTDDRRAVFKIDPPAYMFTAGMIVLFLVVILLWISAFFRLKEKQI